MNKKFSGDSTAAIGGWLFAFALFACAATAHASFGITPPYVKNESLTRGSVYEQKIIVVRSEPVEDLKAHITIDVPGAQEWITIDKGQDFLLPAGSQQVPMTVRMTIPTDAAFGQYRGSIRIVLAPSAGPQAGTVGIALGAQIDVDVTVIDRKIIDFDVHRVSISDTEVGHAYWWLFFPGKIKFTMMIENVGNVPVAPKKVRFDIKDKTGAILETVENTNRLEKVEPFDTKNVVAELPTTLPQGTYQVHYSIFREDEIEQSGDVDLSVLPAGSLQGYIGYGFIGLPFRDKAILILLALLAASIIGFAIAGAIRRLRRSGRRRHPAPPPPPPSRHR